MNLLVGNNYISEMNCGANFSYILNDNNIFLSTEYKVLQSQANSFFIKCMKMMYNGKIQLFYHTQNMKPLASMLYNMDADSFETIVANLLSDIIDVKHNGFLSCQNIDISLERIYVDPATYKVSLVYLPLSVRMHDDVATFENTLRASLIKLISRVPTLASHKTIQLSADLSNGQLSLDDIYAQIKGAKRRFNTTSVSRSRVSISKSVVGNKTLHLIAINAPKIVDIAVNKNEFVIGKKEGVCDFVIDYNNTISRSHCKITKTGDQYFITDLHSASGTYVNRIKIQPAVSQPIGNGDIIRLANSDFQARLK